MLLPFLSSFLYAGLWATRKVEKCKLCLSCCWLCYSYGTCGWQRQRLIRAVSFPFHSICRALFFAPSFSPSHPLLIHVSVVPDEAALKTCVIPSCAQDSDSDAEEEEEEEDEDEEQGNEKEVFYRIERMCWSHFVF